VGNLADQKLVGVRLRSCAARARVSMTAIVVILLLTGVVLTCTIVVARRGSPRPGHRIDLPPISRIFPGSIPTSDAIHDGSGVAGLFPRRGRESALAGLQPKSMNKLNSWMTWSEGCRQTPPLPTVLLQVAQRVGTIAPVARTSLARIVSLRGPCSPPACFAPRNSAAHRNWCGGL